MGAEPTIPSSASMHPSSSIYLPFSMAPAARIRCDHIRFQLTYNFPFLYGDPNIHRGRSQGSPLRLRCNPLMPLRTLLLPLICRLCFVLAQYATCKDAPLSATLSNTSSQLRRCGMA